VKTPGRTHRRGVRVEKSTRLLSLQGPDVIHDLPALLLREVLPRWHRAATIRDFPEQLAVGLLLDRWRRPVGRLRGRQRRCGGAVAPARGPPAPDAVPLRPPLFLPPTPYPPPP